MGSPERLHPGQPPDLGLIGLVLWLAPFALALLLALRANAPPGAVAAPSRFCRRWGSGRDRASWPEFPSMRSPGSASASRRRRLRRGVRRLLRENGRDESSRDRRGRVHRLESRGLHSSARATTSACSTTSRPATGRSETSRRRGRRGEATLSTSVSTPRYAASRWCTTSARSGSVPRSVQDPLTSSAVNIEGTLNVLLAARDEGVRRVIFSSSTSVYGSSRELPTSESTPPWIRSLPTSVAKLAARAATASASARVYDSFETVIPRLQRIGTAAAAPFRQYAAAIPLLHRSHPTHGRAGHHLRRRTSSRA